MLGLNDRSFGLYHMNDEKLSKVPSSSANITSTCAQTHDLSSNFAPRKVVAQCLIALLYRQYRFLTF